MLHDVKKYPIYISICWIAITNIFLKSFFILFRAFLSHTFSVMNNGNYLLDLRYERKRAFCRIIT